MTRFEFLDWLAIGGYLVFALGVGFYMTKRASRSTGDFYLAGRSLKWWVAGTSLVATSFAADTPLVVSGWVRSGGIYVKPCSMRVFTKHGPAPQRF